ncbi:hypothetical protein [Litchfieldia salsa]|uniref:Uncharacterized protein n=1 Tax=Litchfieldia salsa TaxID=930152 RepID=A0A1H0TCL2_9BACI|nr:hypothetical protein [Litchfieldia salsa]SDP51749.1 hypothetical protein SAMN05216565_103420 [Litchfieldia salsa]
MSLEWFDRVSGELQDHLESICDKYDQVGHMSIDRGAKHPRIEFFVETTDDGERDYFCSLFFDPHNEEFYVESYDLDLQQESRAILLDIEDIVDCVHESFHEYMNDDEDDEEYEYYLETTEDDDDLYLADDDSENETEVYQEIDVEWTTPEVTAYSHEDEVEVTYQFGIVQETGDGVLRRVNRVVTTDEDLIEDESNFIFSKEEASTIIALIATHMDSLSDFDFDMIDG